MLMAVGSCRDEAMDPFLFVVTAGQDLDSLEVAFGTSRSKRCPPPCVLQSQITGADKDRDSIGESSIAGIVQRRD